MALNEKKRKKYGMHQIYNLVSFTTLVSEVLSKEELENIVYIYKQLFVLTVGEKRRLLNPSLPLSLSLLGYFYNNNPYPA